MSKPFRKTMKPKGQQQANSQRSPDPIREIRDRPSRRFEAPTIAHSSRTPSNQRTNILGSATPQTMEAYYGSLGAGGQQGYVPPSQSQQCPPMNPAYFPGPQGLPPSGFTPQAPQYPAYPQAQGQLQQWYGTSYVGQPPIPAPVAQQPSWNGPQGVNPSPQYYRQPGGYSSYQTQQIQPNNPYGGGYPYGGGHPYGSGYPYGGGYSPASPPPPPARRHSSRGPYW